MIAYRCTDSGCAEVDIDKLSPAGILDPPASCGECGQECTQTDVPAPDEAT